MSNTSINTAADRDRHQTENPSTESQNEIEEGVKKSAVKGLPKAAAVKQGYANGERPGFKAKSSKATGAKYRVRQ